MQRGKETKVRKVAELKFLAIFLNVCQFATVLQNIENARIVRKIKGSIFRFAFWWNSKNDLQISLQHHDILFAL